MVPVPSLPQNQRPTCPQGLTSDSFAPHTTASSRVLLVGKNQSESPFSYRQNFIQLAKLHPKWGTELQWSSFPHPLLRNFLLSVCNPFFLPCAFKLVNTLLHTKRGGEVYKSRFFPLPQFNLHAGNEPNPSLFGVFCIIGISLIPVL